MTSIEQNALTQTLTENGRTVKILALFLKSYARALNDYRDRAVLAEAENARLRRRLKRGKKA